MRRVAGWAFLALLVAPRASGQETVAPNDPVLIKKMSQLCLRTALGAGGIDRATRAYCDCVAPVFARHMTAGSRYRLAVENRMDLRPEYDDANATYADALKSCPPAR